MKLWWEPMAGSIALCLFYNVFLYLTKEHYSAPLSIPSVWRNVTGSENPKSKSSGFYLIPSFILCHLLPFPSVLFSYSLWIIFCLQKKWIHLSHLQSFLGCGRNTSEWMNEWTYLYRWRACQLASCGLQLHTASNVLTHHHLAWYLHSMCSVL